MFKWLMDLFFGKAEERTNEEVPEKAVEVTEGKQDLVLRLETPKFKKGYSPRVYDGDDLVWMSPDYMKTEKEAVDNAKKYFCQAWAIK